MFNNQNQGGYQQQPMGAAPSGGMNFADTAGQGQDMSNTLIPNNQLAFANIGIKGIKTNANTGKRSMELELTIAEGQPYAGRKVWMFVADPAWEQNYEKNPSKPNAPSYGEIARIHIGRILEVGNNASPQNPNGYNISSIEQLAGMTCAIQIGVEKGTVDQQTGRQYSDKNTVVQFLSNNPESSTFQTFQKLAGGVYNTDGNAAAPAQNAAPQQAAAPQQGQMFGANPGVPQQAPVQQGFTQGQPQAQNQAQGQFPANNSQQPPQDATHAANPQQATAPQGNPPATNASTFPSNNQGQPQQAGFNPNQAPSFIQNSNQ